MTTVNQLIFELADIERKLKAADKPEAWRTPADKRYFSRLLAGYKRRKAKLHTLNKELHQ